MSKASKPFEKKFRLWINIVSISVPIVVALLFGIRIPNVEALTFLPPMPLYLAIVNINQGTWRYYAAPLMAGIALWLMHSAIIVVIPEFGSSLEGGLTTISEGLRPLSWSWPKALWLQLSYGAVVVLLAISMVVLPLRQREGVSIRQGHLQWIWRVLILALAIAGLSPDEKIEVFLWLALPLSAVLYANLLELRQHSLLREFLAFVPLVLPLALLLLK